MGSSSNDKTQENSMIIVPVAILLLVTLLVPLLKYVPLFFLAIPIALIFYDNFQEEGITKVTKGLWSLAFLGFVLCMLIGFPVDSGYFGFIPFSPVSDWLSSAIHLHNGFIGKISRYAPRVVQQSEIKNLTVFQASQYFWLVLPLGIIQALVLYGVGSWKEKHFKTGAGVWGAKTVRPILVLIQKPVIKALSHPWEPKEGLTAAFGIFMIMMLLSYLETTILKDIPKHHPVMFLCVSILYVLIFYFLGISILTARALSQRMRLLHFLVPIFDLVMSPIYSVLCLDISDSRKKINLSNQVPIGIDVKSGKDVILTEKNLNYHTQVIGGSGAGKTNLIKNVITSRVFGGKGLIFLDLKADFDTVVWMKKVCAAADRAAEFKLFSMANPEISLGYNPLARGTATEIHSRIMNAMKWSEEFYRKTSSHALSDALILLCEIRDMYRSEFYLENLQKAVSEWSYLEYLVSEFELSSTTKDIIKKRIELLKAKDGAKQVQGISTDLLNVVRSKAGPLLMSSGDRIDLFESIQKGEVVYFLMDSMSDKESSELLGRILLQDLIGATGMIYSSISENDRKSTQVIIDEFAAFASDNFIDFINRARGAGLGVMVAHQSRGDLKSVHETFCDRVERNCATKLIFGTDNSEDAEYFASMLGTHKTLKDTFQMRDGLLSTESTGLSSRREVEEFVIHPNEIKGLGQGEVLRISRTVDSSFNITKVYMASNFDDIQVQFDSVSRNLEPKRATVTEEFKQGLPNISNSNDGEVFL